jgi:hypothetical protein
VGQFSAGKVGQFSVGINTHSGDTWLESISVQDFRGLELFTSPNLNGPNHMNDGNPPPHYPFGPIFFNYDPSKFEAAVKAVAHSWC